MYNLIGMANLGEHMLTNTASKNAKLKIPSLLHFTRLGYEYVSLKDFSDAGLDLATNIHIPTLCKAINRINAIILTEEETQNLVDDLSEILRADDLGREFYSLLVNGCRGLKLIDLETPGGSLNTYQVVANLECKNKHDSFCADINVVVNGIPLGFIRLLHKAEIQHTHEEFERMQEKGSSESLRCFVNLTQFLVFSNNEDYGNRKKKSLKGAYYATTSYKKLCFNRLVEEDLVLLSALPRIQPQIEKYILADQSCTSLIKSSEYLKNLYPLTPTNKILTSLFSKERIVFFLKYGFLFAEKPFGDKYVALKKYIMRYPQLFATKAIAENLEKNRRRGVILHSPGSGKTTLASFAIRYFSDFFKERGVAVQFYYVVDRTALAQQVSFSFRSHGLYVEEVSCNEELEKRISSRYSTASIGISSVVVVNIQNFSNELCLENIGSKKNVQHFYFLDEVQRSYIPSGSFLKTLLDFETNAIAITLTGTPLKGYAFDKKNTYIRKKMYEPREVFGEYIHQYTYTDSILDGYTLDLQYKRTKLAHQRDESTNSREYLLKLLGFILKDFTKSKKHLHDDTIGAIIICQSVEQAHLLFEEMQDIDFTTALLLEDVGTAESRKKLRSYFVQGKLDFLVTYDMILAGFNIPRLKKVYIGREINDYSLLQAFTRANRPYGEHHVGYVVDFTNSLGDDQNANKKFFDELHADLSDST